jgi:hypothetical protein
VEFITTKKGIRWVRVVVPDDLVSVIGKKNLMESLETKDNHVATERAPAVIARFQTQIEEASGQVAWEQIATRANRGPNFLSDTARLCVRVRASRPEPVPGIAAAAIQAHIDRKKLGLCAISGLFSGRSAHHKHGGRDIGTGNYLPGRRPQPISRSGDVPTGSSTISRLA